MLHTEDSHEPVEALLVIVFQVPVRASHRQRPQRVSSTLVVHKRLHGCLKANTEENEDEEDMATPVSLSIYLFIYLLKAVVIHK